MFSFNNQEKKTDKVYNLYKTYTKIWKKNRQL